MEPITLRQLLEAVDGTLLGEFSDLDATFTAVDTDSRNIRPGSLFIPLQGERFDGHAFLPAALSAGAAGCLTARTRDSYEPRIWWPRYWGRNSGCSRRRETSTTTSVCL